MAIQFFAVISECDKRIERLYVGQILWKGEFLCSKNSKYKLLLQSNGDFLIKNMVRT